MVSLMFLLAALAGAAPAPKSAPYGSWKSPITTEMLVQGQVRFGDLTLDGDTLYWVEMRPEEAGRLVIARRSPDGRIEDVLPPPFSARTLVHEYGGGALMASDGTVFFSNFEDQRLWRVQPGQPPEPLTAPAPQRFADYVIDRPRSRLICVSEDHSQGGEPVNRISSVDLASGRVTHLVEGRDFFSSPRVSPDGKQLAWLSWNHPNMPWDGSELSVASFGGDGSLGPPRSVAGGVDESIFQPEWSPDGRLYFVSDRSNWWNLYRETAGHIEQVVAKDAEFGLPQWVFGQTTYGFRPDGDVLACYTQGGSWHLVQIAPDTGHCREITLPYTNLTGLHVAGHHAYLEASSPSEPESLIQVELATGSHQVLRKSSPQAIDPDYTSLPEAIEFPTDGEQTAHAFYYPPANVDYQGSAGTAPPLLVVIHGGPTSATRAQFRFHIQYWTSRGFGVCDVNYGGSTGYGREFRNRLRGAWGVVDVADAANAALFLAERGLVARDKLIIRGGSAGGYTTLAALAFRDVFRCGASYYGVSDLALLAADTHKFESRYLDRLVGPYPEEKELYRQRSPISHLDSFDRPVILLQGLEDRVVPPNQAELILQSLKSKGVPVAYVPFEGEQHGFRKAENIIRAQEAELYFYARVLGFALPQRIEPVQIHHLPAERD